MSLKSQAVRLAAGAASLAALGAVAQPALAAPLTQNLSCAYPLVGNSRDTITFDTDAGSPPPFRGVPAPTFNISASLSGTGLSDGTPSGWRVLGATTVEGTISAKVTLSGAGLLREQSVGFKIPKTAVSTSGEQLPLKGDYTHPSVTYPQYGPVDLLTSGLVLHLTPRRADGSIVTVPQPLNPATDDSDASTLDIACIPAPGASAKISTFQVGHGDPGLPGTPAPKLDALGPGAVSLSWAATTWPDGTELQTAQSYTVTVTDGQNGSPVLTKTVTEPTITFGSELSNRTKYNVTVTANYVGATSLPSAAVVFTTLGGVGPLAPGILALAPNTGPTEGGNEVSISLAFGARTITSATFGGKAAQIVSQTANAVVVKAPPGTANSTVDVIVTDESGSSANTPADDYTYRTIACNCGGISFSLTGSATLKTVAKGAVPLTGAVTGVALNLSTGALSSDLALNPASAKLVALGFLPVTANLAFQSQARMTGTVAGAGSTLNAKVRIKLTKMTLLGLTLPIGSTCQAKTPSNLAMKSSDFTPLSGGTFAGTFVISDLTGCGAATGIVSPLTAGKNNAIAFRLTPSA